MSTSADMEHVFDFIGGSLGLDFANTVGGLPADSPTQERLTSYPRLVAWGQQANLISESEAAVLLRKAASAPGEAATILERAHTFREAMRAIFMAAAQGHSPSESDLGVFNAELEQGMAGTQIRAAADGFEWAWRTDTNALDGMLAPIVRSAATLLTSPERQFVRKCAHDICPWMFVDTTKNHRRQWCRTSGCGNMMRVRKHRERQRDQEQSDSKL